MSEDRGLVDVAAAELEELLSAIETGRVPSPVTKAGLIAASFGHAALVILDGLDARAASLILRAALAERRWEDHPKVDLVWTGPEAKVSTARDTAVLLRELFSSAEKTVLLAGYAFDHGEDLLFPLFERMRDRGVVTTMFFDVPGRAPPGSDADAFARRAIDGFFAVNWPFAGPRPKIYYDPRTAMPFATASLHAKCVVIDGHRSLITSANFTDRGQTRNIELGVLIESRDLGTRVEAQWRGLIQSGLVREYGESRDAIG